MEDILSTLRSVNVDPMVFLKTLLVLSVGSVVFGLIGFFAFGKKSIFSRAVSSAISILFVYAVAIMIYSAFPALTGYIPSLPFVEFQGSSMVLFTIQGAAFTEICSNILGMIILAFLANLLDALIPNVKNFFGWLLLKSATVIGAIALQLLVNWLFASFLPVSIITLAPVILLVLLIVSLLVGALNPLVGTILATFNPIFGALYSFFFSTFVGKAISKAMLTTLFLAAIVLALTYVGCTVISIATAALIVYIPLVVVLVLVWYLINRFL